MIEKKKLLVASDTIMPRIDGVSIFLKNIIPRLKKDFDITLIAPNFDHSARKVYDVKTIFTKLSMFKAGDYPLPYPSFKKIKEAVLNSDIVFTNSLGPIGILTIRFAKKYKKPVYAYAHSIDFNLWSKSIKASVNVKNVLEFISKRVMQSSYKKCTKVFIPSREVESLFNLEKIKAKYSLVPMGIDCGYFSPSKNKEKSKKTINISSEKIVLGFVGRIAREKDLKTLIYAFETLEKKHKNLTLLIIGPGLEDELDKIITSKHIHVLGEQKDVLKFLEAMDIFILPSLTETSSLATLEAMSCRLPVVATPVGLLKEIILRGENGFLFPKGSSETLSSILDELIVDENLRKKVGKLARATIKNNFSWEKTAKKLIQEFNE